MTDHRLHVAAYCRVSTDREDQANSLASQRNYFAEYITHHEGWVLHKVYFDEGISGTQTGKRAGFNSMIRDAMQGEIDLILTKEVCRFARNTVDTLSFIRKLRDRGIGVIFTIDNIDTRDSDGELRLTIMASIAQEESRKTSERVKWGQKRRMEQGVVFGRDLLGYRVCNGNLIINQEEVPVVQAIFHKYTNEGKGAHTIARELAEEGFSPKRAVQWSNTVILRILRNEKYVGDLCQKKTYTPDYLTHAKKYNRGNEEMICLRDHHSPIIDRNLWERTQEELQKRSYAGKMNSKHSNRYWCSGKLHCGSCGQRYVSFTRKRKDKSICKAWRCYEAASHGSCKISPSGITTGCDNGSVNDGPLLSAMHYCLCLLPIDRDSLRKEILLEIRIIAKSSAGKSGSDHVREKINNLIAKKRKTLDLMLDGTISRSDWQEQVRWYDTQLKELYARRMNNSASEGISGSESTASASLADPIQRYSSALDEILTFDESNGHLYRELLEKIVIYRDRTVDIWLKQLSAPVTLSLSRYLHVKEG